MELRELVRQTREALSRGEEVAAAAAARHMLEAYPSSMTAHQMLGESLIEQGELDDAHEHFSRAVAIDPLNTIARLGLGVIAEEREDAAGAYDAYLGAWEIKPEMDQLRDELVRLQEILGRSPRVHPTQTGLAMTYARAGDDQRAVKELQAVVGANPADVAARLALASLLWRNGEDDAAATAGRAVLDQLPECARALAILADIGRRGQDASTDEMIDLFRSVDPLADVAAELSSGLDERDLAFLAATTAELPDFAIQMAGEAEPTTIPPSNQGAAAVNGDASNTSNADPWDSVLREMGGETATADEEDEPLQPFSWNDDAPPEDLSTEFTNEQLEAARPGAVQPATPTASDQDVARDDFADLDLQPFQLDGEANTSDGTANAPLAGTEWGTDDQSSPDSTAPAESGELIDLTAGWDDLDSTLAEATPPAGSPGDFDDLLQGLEAEGITPLDPNELAGEQEWEPRSADEWAADIEDTSPGDTDDDPREAAVATPETTLADSDSLENTDAHQGSSLAEDASLIDELDTPAPGDSDAAPESPDDQATAALSAVWGDMDDPSGALDGPQGYTDILRNLDAEQEGELAPATGNGGEQDQEEAEASAGLDQQSQFATSTADVPDAVALSSLTPFSASPPDFPSEPPSYDTASYRASEARVSSEEADRADSPDEVGDTPSEAEFTFDPDPADTTESSPWPRSAPGLAGLNQSTGTGFNLFARLREEKRSLVELGIVVVDRRLGPANRADAQTADQGVTSLERDAVRQLYQALDQSADARDEAVGQLEAIAADAPDAAVSRLLAEAYLRLSRPEDAAIRFREAVQQRSRV